MPPKRKNRVGEFYTTNEGYLIEIVEYNGNRDCTVKFEDGTLVKHKEYACVKKGAVKNPFHKSIEGVGYYGQGKYTARGLDGEKTLVYNTFRHMLMRCYNEKFLKKHPTYKDCEVAEEWHNFQNFAKWFEENYNPQTMEGWELDKDLLIKDNKIYSLETCCFVPNEINCILSTTKAKRGKYPIGVSREGKFFKSVLRKNSSGERNINYLGIYKTPEEAFQVYKTEKEKYIKEVADKWKHKIPIKVYENLYNHEVKITD